MLLQDPETHLAAILDRPDAPNLVARLQTQLEQEQQRRQQFYAEVDEDMKAEFINGEVIIQSPVKKAHTDAAGALYKLLSTFVQVHQLGYVGYEKVMTAFTRNDYEPDVVFFGLEKSQHFQKGLWKYPPPDFVAEVLSDSTEARDRGVKFQDFEAHGVQEYWIIDPEDESVEQYLLYNGAYKLHLKAGQGPVSSRVVAGFEVPIRALFDEQVQVEALRRMLGE
ncbi:MAG: Uma2 family endonuclease [Bacteroidetes bacterium]|nr:MAG: Uma2 family endonuclease [Bacteroidota bacterium]